MEQFAPEFGFDVALKLDEFNNANFEGVTAENFRDIDVSVDFSIPAAVLPNWCAKQFGNSFSSPQPRGRSRFGTVNRSGPQQTTTRCMTNLDTSARSCVRR